MSDALSRFINPHMKDIGPSWPRSPQRAVGTGLDGDAVIVSADGHWEIVEDIFYEGFPAHLKEKAPRVWFDKYWRIGYRGEMEAFPNDDRVERVLQEGTVPGAWDMCKRWADLEAEGVHKEIVFPQSLLSFVRYPDLEIQENMYRTYNEYMARLGKERPHCFYGVGVFSNWWDPAGAE